MSCIRFSSHVSSLTSRLFSRILSADPSALRASSAPRPSAIASATCASSSSSISRFTLSLRNTFAILFHCDISRLPHHAIDRRRHRLPARLFRAELFPSRRCQFIDPCPPPVLLVDPFGPYPSRLFHPMKRRIQRPFLHPQHFPRNVLNGRHDGVPVQPRPPRQDLQH